MLVLDGLAVSQRLGYSVSSRGVDRCEVRWAWMEEGRRLMAGLPGRCVMGGLRGVVWLEVDAGGWVLRRSLFRAWEGGKGGPGEAGLVIAYGYGMVMIGVVDGERLSGIWGLCVVWCG